MLDENRNNGLDEELLNGTSEELRLEQQGDEEVRSEGHLPEALANTHEITRKYVRILTIRKLYVLCFWGFLFLIGLIFAPKFMEVVILMFDPPNGTPGHEAQRKMKDQFPGSSRDADTIILINTKDETTPLLKYENSTRRFVKEISQRIKDWGKNKADPPSDFMPLDYFSLSDWGAQYTAGEFLSDSLHPELATAMFMTVHLQSGFQEGSMEGNRFADFLDKELKKLRKECYGEHANAVEIRSTGMLQFIRDMQEGSEKDMMRMDSLSFPFALIILAYMLRSVRMLIIPMVNIMTTVVTAFTLMYPVAKSTTVVAVAPSVMMSVSVAFSLDYSLFLLSRYREEIMKGATVEQAVIMMVDAAGHTILVSGGIIALCWLGLLLFPVTLLATIGLGAGLTVVIALIVNISLTPSILLYFDKFFTNFEQFGMKGCCDRCLPTAHRVDSFTSNDPTNSSSLRHNLMQRNSSLVESPCSFDAFGRRMVSPGEMSTHSRPGYATPDGAGVMRTPTLNADGTVRGEISSPIFGMIDPVAEVAFLSQHSIWYRCGDRLFGTPLKALGCIFLFCALILPLTPYAVDFHHSESYKLFTPSKADATVAAEIMGDLYGGGRIQPYLLLVEPPEGTKILTNSFFQNVQELIEGTILPLKYGKNKKSDALLRNGVNGMMYMNGYNISFTPFGDRPHEITVVGCAFEVGVEVGEELIGACAKSRCEAELQACENDQTGCGQGLTCLHNCDSDDILCAAACVGKYWDKTSFDLAKCTFKQCIDRATTSPSRNQNMMVLNDAIHEEEDSELVASPVRLGVKPDCKSVVLQFFQSISGFHSKSTLLMLNLQIDPFSQDGTTWLDTIRDKFKDLGKENGYYYGLVGGDVAGHDTVNKVFDLFPLIITIILVAVFLVVAFSFKSILIPIRAIFTIALTLILVYGMGVLTYERDLFGWTGIAALTNKQDSLTWLVPAMAAPICVGFSLDYDVFLLSRIVEYVGVGFKTRDSIMCGLAQTGGIITSAGLIMFFAFFGLMLSDNPSLNQLSMFLCVSVLADTFIIRTILVPSLMLLAGDYNWYPWKPATLDY